VNNNNNNNMVEALKREYNMKLLKLKKKKEYPRKEGKKLINNQ
jgi:predicted GIY-YIG superfamily endonuclease